MNEQRCGAVLHTDGHCEWRAWAPQAIRLDLVLFDDQHHESKVYGMTQTAAGYFTYRLDQVSVGQRYAFRLNGRSLRPDPASLWQPDGVHRPSAVWRADDFQWTDQHWKGIALSDLVIYELHVGTFTPEGTFAAIIPRLDELKALGITAIELMPVGQFSGERGWGYDGVYWYAVQQSYGGPTALQALVDACHSRGLALILDVVYNHFGPEGNYFGEFGPIYTRRHHTPWGSAINYTDQSCRPVRDFVLDNVRQWIRDFHVDGLRLDAIHAIFDDGPIHILTEIKQTAAVESEHLGRQIQIVAESNLNDIRVIRPQFEGGLGLDAQWNDDFHHCVHALLTGERDGYYADFGNPEQQLIKALQHVFVYDGCYSPYRGHFRGTTIGDIAGNRFVVSIQNHDQVGNRPQGDRFGTLLDPVRQRLAAGLLLLSPFIPMLFMGEEYGETRGFPFFCDFENERLREAVKRGRREEFKKFTWGNDIPDPNSPSTFASAILTWDWPDGSHQCGLRRLYRELLELRRVHPAMRDFTHRKAELIERRPGEPLLFLTRGDPATPDDCLHAIFNLSDESRFLESPSQLEGKLLLYSDDTQFCGSGGNSDFDGWLQPFTFAVFGNRMEVN